MWKCKEWWNLNLTLCIWCGTLSQHPLPPTRCHLSIHPNNQPRKDKKFWKKIKLSTNCMVLPWPTYTKPGLREAQTPCPKLHALERIKPTAQTLPNNECSWGVVREVLLNANIRQSQMPLANQKVRPNTKSMVSF